MDKAMSEREARRWWLLRRRRRIPAETAAAAERARILALVAREGSLGEYPASAYLGAPGVEGQ
ncbi:hypothetical protein AB0F72_17835 [Actinoplanes sp. NPDC023936]|uniref:hypothetical protein n=1 Tax=Actinoplanes sp. NPDC023936 TaxID=3154910 RepID=UPI0034069FE8